MIQKIARERKMTAREAAKKFGKSPRTIRRLVALDREDYENRAAERRRIAGTMRATGASWPEIAAAIGCTEWAAQALVKRYKAECKASGRDTATGDLFASGQTEKVTP